MDCYFPDSFFVLQSMKFLILSFLAFSSLAAKAQELTISGTIHHSLIEGGCWYLQGDGGKRYELTGDAEIVQPLCVDGQHVVVRAMPMQGAASICMMGEIVRVLQRIDTVRYPIDLPIWPMTIDGNVHRTKSGVWYVKTSSGQKYEFKNIPEKKYRHAGAAIHQRVRVLLDKKSNKDNMDGVILSESKPIPITKQKTYDPR
jgi:hypothetical protein